jgi:hypothetical protein
MSHGSGVSNARRDAMNRRAQRMAGKVPSVDIARLPLWLYPPPQWQNLDQIGYEQLPNIGASVDIVSFTVPIGYNGIINKLANEYQGSGFTQGSGALAWSLQVDATVPPGPNTYFDIPASLGTVAAPTKISGFRIYELQTITLLLSNVSLALAGTQLVGGRLMGYLYPVTEEDLDIWT